jgi:GMP synthase (glutamine-hydrolysing)
MKPILIIKTGSTLASLKSAKGDFEDWIIHGSALPEAAFQVVNVETGETLPAYETIAAVMITGSHAMVSERLPWSETAAHWLAGAVVRGLPTLGVCYGHQLLAHALGGEVGYNPKGLEKGTVEITLTPEGQSDPLLSSLPPTPCLHVSHAQSVLRLPHGAVRLAYSRMDNHQAFCVNGNAWGVQFHPEFDADIVRAYIQADRRELIAAGQDPQSLLATCQDTPFGSQVLQRFVFLASAVH